MRSFPFAVGDFVVGLARDRDSDLDLERERIEFDLDRVRPWRGDSCSLALKKGLEMLFLFSSSSVNGSTTSADWPSE